MRICILFCLALAVGQPASAGPAGKAPKKTQVPAAVRADPNWKMLDHVEAVFDLLEKHKGDCEQTVVSTTAYVEQHKKILAALRRQAQDNSLCPKAKKKADPRIQQRAERLGEQFSPLMFEFYKRCPDHVDRLHRGAMQFLGSKCKQDGTQEPAGH